MLEYCDANPRTRAIARARAEALTIEHSNQLARVEIELRALSLIRSHRLARTAKGLRIRLTLIAAATGITCGVFGYWIRAETPGKVQLHVIEREVAVVANLETTPAVVSFSGESSQVPESAVSAPRPASPTSPSSQAEPQQTTNRLAVLPVAPVLGKPPTTSLAPVPVLVPIPVRTLVIAQPQVARLAQPQAKQLEKPKTVLGVPTKAADPGSNSQVGTTSATQDAVAAVPKLAEANDVILPVKPQLMPRQPAVVAVAPSTDYKVVNVIEGTVMVRQGQSVRQIRIGEKMPDGQILKSVNVEKGEFETLPKN